jgi:hypothetical protein
MTGGLTSQVVSRLHGIGTERYCKLANIRPLHSGSPTFYSLLEIAILNEIFRGFPQNLHANSGMMF